MHTLVSALMSIEGPHNGHRTREPLEDGQATGEDYPLPTQSEMWRRNLKSAMKEAVKEWLDDQFATFGRWSLTALLAVLVAAAVWLVLTAKGWKPPP
jgi:hypothetical protein